MKMNQHYSTLFSPFQIKGVTFRNRIIMAPFLPQNADADGLPSEYGMAYYERRAIGGAAQLTIGETPVDLDRACRKYGGYLDLTREHYTVRENCMLSELTLMMHQHHTIAGIELSHVGLWNHPDYIRGHQNPVGPVAMIRPDGVQVDALTPEMMTEIAKNFAHTAANAKRFGFDSVMIHGGHGWLQSQFLSPLFNTRTDQYGGSLENRARFPIQIIDAVRAAVGEDMLIEYRVSADELTDGGITLDETIAFLKMIEAKIDLVHVSVGCYQNPVTTRTFPSVYEPYGCNAELSAAIKREISCPVAVVGAINTPEVAEAILAEGKADFVAIAKQLIADPDFPKKAAAGHTEDIVPCIRCYRCMGEPGRCPNVICSVNPQAAREFRIRELTPAHTRKRVVILGGGPAGMKAALTAAERGHSVILLEKDARLGGALNITEQDRNKKDLHRYRDFLIRQVSISPEIKVCLNFAGDPEAIRAFEPDAIILAIGAIPVIPAIPGLDETPGVRSASEAYLNTESLGKRVAIIGGGLVGCELGIYLRDLGREVIIIEQTETFARDCVLFPRMALEKQLNSGIRLMLNTRVQRIAPESVYTDKGILSADSVVFACGYQPAKETERYLAALPNCIAIGDCVKPGKIVNAIHEAFFTALDL